VLLNVYPQTSVVSIDICGLSIITERMGFEKTNILYLALYVELLKQFLMKLRF
jgi:hypothetical protein